MILGAICPVWECLLMISCFQKLKSFGFSLDAILGRRIFYFPFCTSYFVNLLTHQTKHLHFVVTFCCYFFNITSTFRSIGTFNFSYSNSYIKSDLKGKIPDKIEQFSNKTLLCNFVRFVSFLSSFSLVLAFVFSKCESDVVFYVAISYCITYHVRLHKVFLYKDQKHIYLDQHIVINVEHLF